ncbi:MAG: TonB-dependent receptor [Steroidobacteraceae bacterium]
MTHIPRPRNITSKVALAVAMAITAGALQAQTTTGTIVGEVASAAGKTIVVESNSGFKREVSLGSSGRYEIPNLPLGVYKVTVLENGNVVDSRENVSISIGSTTAVSFTDEVLDTALVSATSNRAIDVSTTDTRTVITAEELAVLPLGRTAEAIALLAPGVVPNSGAYLGPTGTPLVSFGGSAATENAYYLNGFNTTEPYRNLGGLGLPYGAIDQQEVFSGGYGALYGRSNGGVLNQVGKRGTNDWTFGAGAIFELDQTRAKAKDLYYEPWPTGTNPFEGRLYRPNGDNAASSYTYNAYVGGPVLEDKLFFFVAAEKGYTYGDRANAVTDTSAPFVSYTTENTRWYAKVDWQIAEGHLLELTSARDEAETEGSIFNYSWPANAADSVGKGSSDYGPTTFRGPIETTKRGNTLYVGKYTGYLSDSLTLSALYGYQETPDYSQPPTYDDTYVVVGGQQFRNPAYTAGRPATSLQTVSSLSNPDRHYEKSGYRVDLNWRLGSHSLTFGIDNQTTKSKYLGTYNTGPGATADGSVLGYSWTYARLTNPAGGLISSAPSQANVNNTVTLPNGFGGYYVSRGIGFTSYGTEATQTAQYIEDRWKVTDNLLLTLGLRADQFTNYTAAHDPYAKVDDAIAPRFGFSWDVNGNSTFKVFGSAGRYYLGLPLAPSGLVVPALATTEYFTYTGIDPATGYPTGLTSLGAPVSANSAFGGSTRDYRAGAAKDLKGEAQDEFILGLNKAVDFAGQSWVAGARLVYRTLLSAVDDTNYDTAQVQAAAAAAGFSIYYGAGTKNVPGVLINPGETNTLELFDAAGVLHELKMTREDWGFPKLKRDYMAAEFALEKPLRDKWYAKFTYVLSKSEGTTEGQLRSDLYRSSGVVGVDQGQVSVSTTQSWDDPSLMEYFDGVQLNDHTHQIKAYGYYQLTEQFGVSSNFLAVSGAPKAILGYYYGTQFIEIVGGQNNFDPAGYGGSYHFNGFTKEAAPPGSAGRMPWTFQLDLGASYKPSFADGKLAFNVNVFNVLNAQRATYRFARTERALATPHEQYDAAMFRQTPRYARLSVNYDF